MVFLYAFVSEGNDLDGETFDVQAQTRDDADERAIARTANTFALASAERKAITTCRYVAEYASREAMRRARSAA